MCERGWLVLFFCLSFSESVTPRLQPPWHLKSEQIATTITYVLSIINYFSLVVESRSYKLRLLKQNNNTNKYPKMHFYGGNQENPECLIYPGWSLGTVKMAKQPAPQITSIPHVSQEDIIPSWLCFKECQATPVPVPMPIQSPSHWLSGQQRTDCYTSLILTRNQLTLRANVSCPCTMLGFFDGILASRQNFQTVNKHIISVTHFVDLWWYFGRPSNLKSLASPDGMLQAGFLCVCKMQAVEAVSRPLSWKEWKIVCWKCDAMSLMWSDGNCDVRKKKG